MTIWPSIHEMMKPRLITSTFCKVGSSSIMDNINFEKAGMEVRVGIESFVFPWYQPWASPRACEHEHE